MIYALFILGTFGSSALAIALFLRLNRSYVALCHALPNPRCDRFLSKLTSCVQTALDNIIPASDLDNSGIEALELRYREPLDPYETLAQLLAYLAQKGVPDKSFPADAFIKATYQIGYTLDIPLPLLNECIQIAIDEMKRDSGASIGKIREIMPGEMADGQTMIPLIPGQRVLYPLGVITYSRDNKIISRGKVLCA